MYENSRPIRILHVVGGMEIGGAESMIMNLYRKINKEEFQFDFVVHTDIKCHFDDEIAQLGGDIVVRLPKFNGVNYFKYRKAWKVFFSRTSDYRIIHIHMRSTAPLFIRLAKKYGATVIVHSHGTRYGHNLLSKIKQLFTYPLRYQADYLLACSQLAAEKSYGRSARGKVTIFNNAIDAKKYIYNESIRDLILKSHRLEKKIVIGHIGRFTYAKNHDFLLKIFKEIHSINDNCVLMLIGDGELRDDIKNQIADLELTDSVLLTGMVDNVNEYLQAMDIFVFPSRFEGLPVSVIEAQAAGLECVISDVITDEVDISALVHRMSLSLSEKIWAETILERVKSARRTNTFDLIKKAGYDIDDSVVALEDFYRKIYKRNIDKCTLNSGMNCRCTVSSQ